jgi:hypothetical protein
MARRRFTTLMATLSVLTLGLVAPPRAAVEAQPAASPMHGVRPTGDVVIDATGSL